MNTPAMLHSLFANFCILVTFIFFSGILSRRLALHNRPVTAAVSINSGLLFGLFGLILMYYSFPVGHGSYANLRHLTIVTVSAYIGWLPGLISALLISIGRLILYGMDSSSLAAASGLLLCGVCSSLLSIAPWSRLRKVTFMNLASMALTFAVLVFNLGGVREVMAFFPLQFAISIAAGLSVYYLAEHIQRSNELFVQLEEGASTDYLTGLNNLRQFHRHLDKEMNRAGRLGRSVSLLVLDIDHFKQINDTYGHPAGDAVLKQLARRLRALARSYDTVSRNGGEEFTVLLPDCRLEAALKAAERIRAAVERERFTLPGGQKIQLTLSIGAAAYPECLDEPDGLQLVQLADQALYEAKHAGRNRVSGTPPIPRVRSTRAVN